LDFIVNLKKFFAIAISTYAMCFLIGAAFSSPDPTNGPPITINQYPRIEQLFTHDEIRAAIELETTTTTEATTTTTAPALVPADTPCAEWADEAVAGGWPADPLLLVELLAEAWSESRCLPIGPEGYGYDEYSHYWNGHDYGIMQVNRPAHYKYVVDLYGSVEALIDPVTNFNFAWRLYSELEAKGVCGFKPWSRKC
jgi:hypothetical protein